MDLGNGWTAFLPFFSHRKKCLEITLWWGLLTEGAGLGHQASHLVPLGPLQPFPTTSPITLQADATKDLTSWAALFPPLLVGLWPHSWGLSP